MSSDKSTHLVFDEKKIIISPDLWIIFSFLMEIEKEVESLLGFAEKLKSIEKQHFKMVNFVQFLSNKLKDNNIDFKYNFSEHPDAIANKLNLHLPVRSQMIVLFANLEVLFCLNIAYQKKTDNDENIKKFAMKDKIVKKFINKYLFTDKNKYFLTNKKRFSKISAKQLRGLRNSLTHFFSVSNKISVAPVDLDNKVRKLEDALKKSGKHNSIFISPDDLYNLIKHAVLIHMREWSDDFNIDKNNFKQRILFVQSVVKKNAPAIVLNKNLKI